MKNLNKSYKNKPNPTRTQTNPIENEILPFRPTSLNKKEIKAIKL